MAPVLPNSNSGVLGQSPAQQFRHPSALMIPICQLCNFEGHTTPFCGASPPKRTRCNICGRSNHTSWYCFYNDKGSELHCFVFPTIIFFYTAIVFAVSSISGSLFTEQGRTTIPYASYAAIYSISGFIFTEQGSATISYASYAHSDSLCLSIILFFRIFSSVAHRFWCHESYDG